MTNDLRTEQYRDSSQLRARAALHERFSTNRYGWFRWVFDRFELPDECAILELGAGPGFLWKQNSDRLPFGWRFVLSDFSQGMVREAHDNLSEDSRFQFAIADVQAIPFARGTFDAVVANHMLYHVPNRSAALPDMHRVLRPGGRLYAATNGGQHVRELVDLVRKFDPELAAGWAGASLTFSLENGSAQLESWFKDIRVMRYEDALVVTEAGPVLAYLASIPAFGGLKQRREEFLQFVRQQMTDGVIRITKDSGMITAVAR